MSVDGYRERLRLVYGGRRWILVGAVQAGMTAVVADLRELGAETCLAVAGTTGTGPVPDVDAIVLGTEDPDPLVQQRQVDGMLRQPPPEVAGAVERADPDRRAGVLLMPSQIAATPERWLGRPVHGGRSEASLVFEDKTWIDGFWDELGVPRPPSRVVPVGLDAVAAAHRALDEGLGTVGAGDAREGLNGGATRVRWLRSEDDVPAAVAFLGAHCDRVRVAPFLEGIPCSIHGVVFADAEIALRPVEMVTLRRPSGLLYCGAATFYDPPPAERERMRALARRVGAALRERAGFRGPFTIDGVMTERGFLPTELNARYGAGLNVLARAVPDLPLLLLLLALDAGGDVDWRPRDLETLLVEAADRTRGGGAWCQVRRRWEGTEQHGLAPGPSGYRLAGDGERPQAILTLGPSAAGGFVRFTPDPAHVPTGRSIAPRAVAALALADREFGAGLGPLEPARA